jgi:perosamine synthetase
MVSILLDNQELRDKVRAALKDSGIETRPLFYPAHTMSAFKSEASYPVAESLSKRGINLPSYPNLVKSDVLFICSEIKKALPV